MKVYKVTHNSGLWCKFRAKNKRELEQKIASGLYGILPIRGDFPVKLMLENVTKIERS